MFPETPLFDMKDGVWVFNPRVLDKVVAETILLRQFLEDLEFLININQ
jgi:hypothetical protein